MKLRIKDKHYPIPDHDSITARQSVQMARPIESGGFGIPPAGLAAAFDLDDPQSSVAWLAYCWLALSNAAPEDRVVEPDAVWDLKYGDYSWHLEPEEIAEAKRAAREGEASPVVRPTVPAEEPEKPPPGSPTSIGS